MYVENDNVYRCLSSHLHEDRKTYVCKPYPYMPPVIFKSIQDHVQSNVCIRRTDPFIHVDSTRRCDKHTVVGENIGNTTHTVHISLLIWRWAVFAFSITAVLLRMDSYKF
jgi:hypothetical protein